jgi:hypothetical protein
LRGWRIAVATNIILGFFLESGELFTVSASACASASQSDWIIEDRFSRWKRDRRRTNLGPRLGINLPHALGRHRKGRVLV